MKASHNPHPDHPESLTLGPWTARWMALSDGPMVFELLNDADVVKARFTRPPGSEAQAVAWIENGLAAPDVIRWVLERSSDGRPAGIIALQAIDRQLATAEAGYLILPWARRQGLATAALIAVTEWAFRSLGMHRMYLLHDVENEPSCRVAVQAGYRAEGILRDGHLCYDGSRRDQELHATLCTDDIYRVDSDRASPPTDP